MNLLIREHFIGNETVDRFTKIKESSSNFSFNRLLDIKVINNLLNPNLSRKLERENFGNAIEYLLAEINESESQITVNHIINDLTFYQKGDDIKTVIKVGLLVSSFNPEKIIFFKTLNILSNSKIIFLINNSDIIECNKCISHYYESVTSTILKEFAIIELDLSTFISLANAKKIETRFIGAEGNMGESEFDYEDLLNLKGCYNAVYDEYFETDKLTEEIIKRSEDKERIIKEIKYNDLKLLQEKLVNVLTEPINDNRAEDVSIPDKEKKSNEPFWYVIAAVIILCLFLLI